MGAGNNAGMRIASGRYFLLLNSDAWMEPGAVERLVALADSRPEAAVVGPRLRIPTVPSSAPVRGFPSPWRIATEYFFLRKLAPGSRALNSLYGAGFDHDSTIEVDWVSGRACSCGARRPRRSGPSTRITMFSEETDWCYRLSPGRLGGDLLRRRPSASTSEAPRTVALFRENVRGHLSSRNTAARRRPSAPAG